MKTHPPPYDIADRHILAEIEGHYGGFDYTLFTRFLDIGGHIGGWGKYVLQQVPNAEILGVEPRWSSLALARENVPEATYINALVAYEGTDFVQYQYHDNMGGNTIVPRLDEPFPGTTASGLLCGVITLEELLGDFEPQVMKIDCEGAEYDILLHCNFKTLARLDVIVGEYHLGRDRFFTKIVPRLHSAGFQVVGTFGGKARGPFMAKNSVARDNQ